MDLVLSRQPEKQLKPLFPRDAYDYAQIHAEIVRHLGSDHAAIFARPEHKGDTVRWICKGNISLGWNKLDEGQRQRLLTAIASILLDIQHYVYENPSSKTARYFNECCRVPSLSYLYAVDGKPVLTGWGYAENERQPVNLLTDIPHKHSFLTFLLIGRFPWITTLIALVFGLLVSIFWGSGNHALKVCRMLYPEKKRIEDAVRQNKIYEDLIHERNRLANQWKVLQEQCKIPPVPPLIPHAVPSYKPLESLLPSVTLPSVQPEKQLPFSEAGFKKIPHEKVDLPKEAWKRKDTSMLNGCWHLTTHLELIPRDNPSLHQPLVNWRLCFGQSGKGQQSGVAKDGSFCKGPLHAEFQGDKLVLSEPGYCRGSFILTLGKEVCTRLNDSEASCTRYQDDGSSASGLFKR